MEPVQVVWLDPNRAADVVDQHINSAIRAPRVGHQILCTGERAQINKYLHHVDAVITQFGFRPSHARIDAISHDDLPTFLAQSSCRCPPNSLTGTGHDTDLVLKPVSAGRARI